MNMNLGWKVIAGTICLAIGQLFGAAITDCPVEAWIPWLKWFGGIFNGAGLVLTGVGVSSKVATATNTVMKLMTDNHISVSKALSEPKFVEKVVERRIPYIVKRLGPGEEIFVRENGAVKKE